MPFKTRQQKIAAESRRFVLSENQIKFEPEQKLSQAAKAGTGLDVKKNIADLSYVRGDLLKILLIASAVILTQIGLALTLA